MMRISLQLRKTIINHKLLNASLSLSWSLASTQFSILICTIDLCPDLLTQC